MGRSVDYMKSMEASDPDFARVLTPVLSMVMSDGDLDLKTKTLMVLLIDAYKGHGDAVRALAARARSLGASNGEINETIRLAFLSGGISGLSASSNGYPNTEQE